MERMEHKQVVKCPEDYWIASGPTQLVEMFGMSVLAVHSAKSIVCIFNVSVGLLPPYD